MYVCFWDRKEKEFLRPQEKRMCMRISLKYNVCLERTMNIALSGCESMPNYSLYSSCIYEYMYIYIVFLYVFYTKSMMILNDIFSKFINHDVHTLYRICTFFHLKMYRIYDRKYESINPNFLLNVHVLNLICMYVCELYIPW